MGRVCIACLWVWIVSLHSIMAQVDVGLNAPNVKWYQINSEDYEVIYPEGREDEANRVANILDYLLEHDSLMLSHPRTRVPIILQRETVIPNGFVSIGPWRSEYYLNPPQFQFAGITPWLDMLTLHEYRHVQQVSNARRGVAGKLLRGVFGQGGWAFYNRAVMPRWFLEGDAVFAETVFSKGGRGRTPDFERSYRALRLADYDYHYEKASFRSFKDFVPSHYNLGYYMTTFARREYGDHIWDDIVSTTYSKPGLYRFSKALKEETGLSTKELYQQAMIDLDSWWGIQDQNITTIEGRLVSSSSQRVFTDYRFPNYLSSDSLVVQKSSLDQIRTLYLIHAGREKKLVLPGVSLNEHFSLGGGKLVWSELRFHPRWSSKDYSIVRSYDIESGKLKKITSRSKLFAPGISKDGKRIAAVEVSVGGEVKLVILDANTGNQLDASSISKGDVISFPRWTDDDRTIVVAGRNLNGNDIRSYDIPTKSWKTLFSTDNATIDRVYPKGRYIYFSSSMTGVQNVFAIDTSTDELFQITNSQLGAFDPAVSPDGKKLAYSDYTANGFQTKELLLRDAYWKQPIDSTGNGSNYFSPMLLSGGYDITKGIQNNNHISSRYKYFTKGLLNIHSWYPYVTTEEFGFGIVSKNIMSSLALTGQFTYNTNESSWKALLRSSYGAFFPILDIDISTGQRQSTQLLSGTDTLSLYVGQWKEHTFGGGLRLPFNITHGNYPSSIVVSSMYRHYLVDYLDDFTDQARNEDFGSLDLDFGFQRLQTKATQNIYPKWGQTLRINYQQTLGENENQGEILTLNSVLFFPGLFKNHSFFLSGGFQTEEIVNAYRFEDVFTNARGYSSFPFERIYRISTNYAMPFWYPDLALGSIAYFKRLRGNFFFDYSEGRLLTLDTELRSYGVEIVTDFQFIRLADVGAGVRLGRKIDEDDFFAEFFITSIRF